MASATKTKPALWKRIVSSVKAGTKGGRKGQWSARKAQLATARYKKAGGGYKGTKSSKNSLSNFLILKSFLFFALSMPMLLFFY